MQYVAPFIVIGAGEVLMLVLAEIDLSAGQVYLTAPWFRLLVLDGGVPVGLAIVIALVLSCLPSAWSTGCITVRLAGAVPDRDAGYHVRSFFGLVLVGSKLHPGRLPGTKGTSGLFKDIRIGSWADHPLGLAALLG